MKTKSKSVSLVVASAICGAAFFAFSKTSFSAFFQSDLAVAVVTAAAIAGLAFRDYSRRARSLVVQAEIVRPALRVSETASMKTTAYRTATARKERIAA